ncbi:MAG: hypothetical protein NTW87_07030 [Planctomycetota bacterium]|nr:hypothetical protein [Planctomycetota bacterium]
MRLVCLRLTTNSALRTPLAQIGARAPDRMLNENDLLWLLRMPALGVQPGGNGMSGIGAKSIEPNSLAPGNSTVVLGAGYK